MMKLTHLRPSFLVMAALLTTVTVQSKDYTKYVNPFVGTDGHGHTFTAATYPFGMVQVGPDTRINGWDGCSGYHYSDSVILGFTHTHLSGTGCLDYGDILIMPVKGTDVASHFSHEKETATPGFYRVWLEDPQVDAKMVSGRRMSMHEYSYLPGTEDREIVIDLRHRDRLMCSFLEFEGDRVVKGWRQSRSWAKNQDVYFYAEFSEPVLCINQYDSTFVRLGFGPGESPLKIKIAISSVDCDNARENLLSEKAEGDWNLETLLKRTEAAWNGWLSRVKVSGPEDLMKTFYTSLYHCAIHPSLYSDANGEYRGMDREIHKAIGYDRYTIFSVWDVFRAGFPLYNIIARDYMPDFLESMLSVYKEGGRLPKWELAGNETNTMIGFNAVSVIADAYAKGTLPKEKLGLYYDSMKGSAENHGEGFDLFCKYGFDPAGDDDQSVSKTLEYAYDSWCIATVASALGEEEDYAEYIKRSQYWKNIFDSSTGFMRPREHGCWAPEFNPSKVNSHFTEANSWQYSFFVPQDIAGHIDAFGGVDNYISKLDALFAASHEGLENQLQDVTGLVGQYAHGNEPSHHVAFLYDFTGQPWKTQKLTREICSTFYSSAPDGLCGNEDCGQMSAWYVMSALGMYSVTPGTETMALTSPLFKKAVINTGEARFTIKCDRPELTYIGGAKLRGHDFDAAVLDFSEILKGGALCFRMSGEPSSFGSVPSGVTSIPSEFKYDAHFEEGFGAAQEQVADFSLKVSNNTPIYPSYSAGGPDGLVDGKRGKANWRAGGWQGYRGDPMSVTVDLLGTRTVRGVWAEFLQDMNNYIWMPAKMEVYVSTDGEYFTFAGEVSSTVAVDLEKVLIETWTVSFDPVEAAYIKIVAPQFGEIPSWHRGYGDKSFVFVDEIGIIE